LRGVWRRRSIAVDGADHEEHARVLWLQAAAGFADVRVPLDASGRAEAFAGTTEWRAPRLIWDHSIDWRGGFAGYDCGEIEWCGDALVERGTFGGRGDLHSYEEVWHRIEPAWSYLVLRASNAIIVQVGSFCIAMRDRRARGGEFGVRTTKHEFGSWSDVDVLGDGAALPLLTDALNDRVWRISESPPAFARS
jgi:hypothetical protein